MGDTSKKFGIVTLYRPPTEAEITAKVAARGDLVVDTTNTIAYGGFIYLDSKTDADRAMSVLSKLGIHARTFEVATQSFESWLAFRNDDVIKAALAKGEADGKAGKTTKAK